ncbi:Uncharacterized protein Adt_14838 [Abeliophyllum distichum]|uniref:Uncharacterized protein n=1 Tax=Abeliophyllum distichum TaxID=126358 RepID=A0ABD1U0R6_9LAMI
MLPKTRWVEEHRRALPNTIDRDRDARNSLGAEGCVCITHRNSELDSFALELLSASSAMMKLDKEEANSKKLSKDLKVMSLEKAQLESGKIFLQVRLDSKVAKENDPKAKYEIELKAKERAFAAETTVATANSTFEAMVAKKYKLLAEAKEKIERVRADHADVDGEAEARIVAVYHDRFEDMLEYKDLAHHFMTACREQLVERIVETHL